MRYCKLGKTDLAVSVITMGCWALAGDATWGPQEESESLATVHAALDAGVNFFDTAEGYGGGDSESVLGRALAGRRSEAVIATKVSRANLSAPEVQQACEHSLRRLQTDYIDLYQIHWPSRTVPLDETMEALERLREQGKVRAIGVCNFGKGDLADLLQTGRVESNQLPYSLLWRAIEYEIQQACADQKLGVLCYSPLAQGLLTGKFATPDEVPEGRARIRLFSDDRPLARHGDSGCEDEVFAALDKIWPICVALGQPMARVALSWVLHQPGVTSVIAGARTAEQMRRNAEAADLALSSETIAQLAQATQEVKECVGANADLWQSVSRFR